MNYSETHTHYLIQLPVQAADFRQKLEIVKKLRGRQWMEREKCWAVPKANYATLNTLLSTIQQGLSKVRIVQPELEMIIEPLPALEIEVPLKKQMYAFQKPAVAYNIQKGNTINGDQQGLGKTIETIATVVAEDLFPCLVVTKKSLISNWEAEWKDWTDRQVMIFRPSIKETWPYFYTTGLADVGIVNYESLLSFFVQGIVRPPKADGKGLEDLKVKHINFKESVKMFKSIIFDESHRVKDGTTKTAKICIGLTKTKNLLEKGVFLLTGTPILNDAKELYPQLWILNRAHHFGKYDDFVKTYSGSKNKHNLKQLNYLMHKHCYFRRLKTDVKNDLPPKTRSVVLCDITNRDEYNFAEQNFVKYLKEKLNLSQGQIDRKMRGEVMVQMALLKRIAAKGKMESVREWMESLVEQGEKMVVFGFHKDITEQIANFYPDKSIRLCGTSKSPDDLQDKKKRFQNSPDICIAVCSLSADAEGHTLNAASNLGMVELPWHFGKAEQAEDRIHRINNWMPANIYYFLGENTIDRDIYKLIMDKKDLHEKVTGMEDDIEEKVIDQLINLFTQR